MFYFRFINTCAILEGSVSVYFTDDILAATDPLELLCHLSGAILMKRSVCHGIGVLLLV